MLIQRAKSRLRIGAENSIIKGLSKALNYGDGAPVGLVADHDLKEEY